MRLRFPLTIIAVLLISGCSINDDLRDFRTTVPDRISGLAWPSLVPLGAFEAPSQTSAAPDTRTMAARAAALRSRAARLRARPVLDPARARALRAALRHYGA